MEFHATEDKVRIMGRTLYRDGVRYLSFSGSRLSFTFTGKKAEMSIITDSDRWNEEMRGWMAVYLNEEKEPSKRFILRELRDVYTVFESDEEQTVTIHLVRLSEQAFGKCGVEWIRIDTDKLLAPPAHKEKRIEIIGDSITCGYGVESKGATELFCTATENATKSYSLQVAEAFDADVHLVSWSGIGIISNWVPEDAEKPEDCWLMPMLYQYTDAACSRDMLGEEQEEWEKWDFSRFVPDLILINLGTNDTSYCKNIKERQEYFAAEYDKFLSFVRKNNPQAQILCMLGTMEQLLCPVVERVVEEFRTRQQDAKVHFLHLPFHSEEDGRGADFHPSALTQRKTAKMVIDEIKKNGWL